MPVPFFDNIDMNANRVRDASDAVLAQDYVTLAQLTAATTIGFAANVGDGVATTFNVVHGLGTTDVMVMVQEVSSGDFVGIGASTNGINAVDLTFTVAPTLNQFRVLVIQVV